MSTDSGTGIPQDAAQALDAADWVAAVTALGRIDPQERSAQETEALARALWWTGDVRAAVEMRESAFESYRRAGDRKSAARAALWLADEYESGLGEPVVGRGWLERAASLLGTADDGSAPGWLAMARAGKTRDASEMATLAREALAVGRATEDTDLETRSLARLALALVATGDIESGLRRFDEAMVAATSEAVSLETVGETYCQAFALMEMLGDLSRLDQWTSALQRFMRRHAYPPLVSFCGACCGELFARAGDRDGAEKELQSALGTLDAGSGRARCVHPAAKLVEMRIEEGRYEDAERILNDYRGLPEMRRAEARLALATGNPTVAAALVERNLDDHGMDSLMSVPDLVLLVDAGLASGDLKAAEKAADRLNLLATPAAGPRIEAEALWASGRVAAAAGDPGARVLLQRAVGAFDLVRSRLDAARARLDLARAVSSIDPQLARAEVETAIAVFAKSGLLRDADRAAGLLRILGGRSKSGPRDPGVLTRRESEVLGLVADGLTNQEIAQRLFISPKTVDHHVSRLLTKLGLRNRTEAAAFATRSAGDGPLR